MECVARGDDVKALVLERELLDEPISKLDVFETGTSDELSSLLEASFEYILK